MKNRFLRPFLLKSHCRCINHSNPNSFWSRFKRHRLGFVSFVLLCMVVVISFSAPMIANDKPILVIHHGQAYFPVWQDYPETTFGGVFETTTDYKDPAVGRLIDEHGFMVMPPIAFSYNTIDFNSQETHPAAPSRHHWLGTDDVGRDVVARLLYGLQISLLFALLVVAISFVLGVLIGVVQGYYAGWVDMIGQRLTEIYSGLPQLFIILILVSVFKPSFWLLLSVMAMFGWIYIASLVRAEAFRVRHSDYVRACRGMGMGSIAIIRHHVLPNALTPTLSQLPFLLCLNITALTTLDYLGYGLPQNLPSLGELILQGKNNMDALWLSLSAFGVLSVVLSLLIFVGEALKQALDGQHLNGQG